MNINRSNFGKTIINGVELPNDFDIGSVINNVAFSSDGKRYAAVTKSKELIIGDIPEDGKIDIDGNSIKYSKNKGNISFFGGSIIIGGGSSYSFSGNSNLKNDIDKNYTDLRSVKVKTDINNIKLRLSEDEKVYVKGVVSKEPINKDGNLSIIDLDGIVSLPSNSELFLDVNTSVGSVKGDVATKGKISVSSGNIKLKLYSPLTLETKTSVGNVDIDGMISKGRGVYIPPNAMSQGVLSLETSVGNIDVEYKYTL